MMCLLMLTVLMIQLQNFVHLGLVICVAPFGSSASFSPGAHRQSHWLRRLVGIVALVG